VQVTGRRRIDSKSKKLAARRAFFISLSTSFAFEVDLISFEVEPIRLTLQEAEKIRENFDFG
jgi:hypothetical protein